MKKKKPTLTPEEEKARFIAAAHELGCDESEEAFVAKLKKLATVAPMTNEEIKKRSKDK